MTRPVDNSDLLKQIKKLQGDVKELRADLKAQESVTDPYIDTLEALRLAGALAIKIAGTIAVLFSAAYAVKKFFLS